MRRNVHRFRFKVFAFFGVLLMHPPVHAEPLVTLQTEAKSTLKVSTEGNQLAIEINGTTLHFPLTDEEAGGSETSRSSRQADRLLLKGLESRLLNSHGQTETGLFAEAYRLAPDDARVAYWYSRSLVNAGSGKAAQEVFEPHRKAIAEAYPGLSERLAEQIQRRIHLESLPLKLVRQIDKLESAAGNMEPFLDDREPRAAYFRLVDQHGKPVEAAAFQISCNGQNERTRSFERGHFLFTYLHRRSSSPSPCQLRISQYGLQNKNFEFTCTADRVAEAGVFQIKRMGEEDRRPVVIKVVDAHGEPLAGASVTFTPAGNRRNSDRIPNAKTDNKGRVETQLFPNNYTCHVNLADYNRTSQSFELMPDAHRSNTHELTLHRLIAAKIKIKWRAKTLVNPNPNLASSDSVSTGEIELQNGLQSQPYSTVSWVRLQQKDDQLQLQFMEQPHYGPPGFAGKSWMGRVAIANGSSGVFEAIDLKNLEDWKKKSKRLRPGGTSMPNRHQPVIVPTEKGAVYVGKILSRDMHGRFPQLVDFKILVIEPEGTSSGTE